MIKQKEIKKWILAIEKSEEIKAEKGGQKYYEASVLRKALLRVIEDPDGRLPWWLAQKVGED